MAKDVGITKQFLESVLKQPIDKLEVKPGSNLGDGYTCEMFSVDIWTAGKAEPQSIVIKCYPENASRQEMLDSGGSFKVELGVYNTVFPELIKFQEDMGVETVIPLPAPAFIHGQLIPVEERKNLLVPFKSVDNHIIMPDLRKSSNGGYKLHDRLVGFNRDHYALVIEAQATFHALSWAYKCKTGTKSLVAKFPFLEPPFEAIITMVQPYFDANFFLCKQIIEDHPEEVEAINYLQSVQKSSGGLYWNFEYGQTALGHTKDNILKKPLPSVENEESWSILLHGDCWSNNMMFRYDEKTGQPVEVVFLDFQLTYEGDPFNDICETLYTSVDPDERRKHLKSFLHIYYDTFTRVCDTLSVPYLPGWSWEEFNRRFHRAKLIGASMCCLALPILLKNPDELTNLDSAADDEDKKGKSADAMENAANFFAGLAKSKKQNPVLKKRLVAVFREMIEDGIL